MDIVQPIYNNKPSRFDPDPATGKRPICSGSKQPTPPRHPGSRSRLQFLYITLPRPSAVDDMIVLCGYA